MAGCGAVRLARQSAWLQAVPTLGALSSPSLCCLRARDRFLFFCLTKMSQLNRSNRIFSTCSRGPALQPPATARATRGWPHAGEEGRVGRCSSLGVQAVVARVTSSIKAAMEESWPQAPAPAGPGGSPAAAVSEPAATGVSTSTQCAANSRMLRESGRAASLTAKIAFGCKAEDGSVCHPHTLRT